MRRLKGHCGKVAEVENNMARQKPTLAQHKKWSEPKFTAAMGVPMSESLPPEGQATVRRFFRFLMSLHEQANQRLDMGTIFKAWKVHMRWRGGE